MRNIAKVTFVIMGAFIGAGFASGKEIDLFFGRFGTNGIYGIIISALFSGFIIYKVMKTILDYKIETYDEFLQFLLGKLKIRTKRLDLELIFKLLINAFLLISFFVMVAGFAAYFKQEFEVPTILGSLGICIFCYFTFMGNTQRLVKVNSILVPVIIMFLVFMGIKNSSFLQDIAQQTHTVVVAKGNWFMNAILYASYNSILLIPVLIPLNKFLKNKNTAFKIAMSCTLCILLLSIILFGLLLKIEIDINTIELPMVYLAGVFGTIYRYLYGGIILMAILTTAVSVGFGFLENCAKSPKSHRNLAIGMCVVSILVAKISFSDLVNLLYPIFGYLGIIQIFLIILKKRA